MYTNNLIEAYKEQMKYVQYKQIAPDLGISPQMLTEVRKGRTFLKENQILMMADVTGEDKEKALVGLAMDKAKSYEAQSLWANIAKKYNGLGNPTITMACGVFSTYMITKLDYALCQIMLNGVSYNSDVYSLCFSGNYNEVSRNDQKLNFS